jgi:hypothetical protein
MIVLAIGLPIWIIVSWIYDITPASASVPHATVWVIKNSFEHKQEACTSKKKHELKLQISDPNRSASASVPLVTVWVRTNNFEHKHEAYTSKKNMSKKYEFHNYPLARASRSWQSE